VNYQVLAQLIEAVSGAPWARYLAERVFAPLGTTGTVAAATSGEVQPGPGHILLFGVPVARPELDGLLAGSGGVVSTAEDMGRWLVAQTAGGGSVLRPDDVALMQTPPPGVAGGYAMGWQRVAPDRLEHTGILSTYSAVQVLLPESDRGFVLLFDGNSAEADTAGVAAGLAALLTGDPQPPWPRSTALVAAVLGATTLAVLALRTRQLVRVSHWRRRSLWAALPGLVWLVVPVALLVAMPALLGAAIGRSFTFWQLCLSMPDAMVLIAAWALSGVAVAAVRIVALARAVAWRG
jgi:CubicO group peptidase (beta-lactamase class C family)